MNVLVGAALAAFLFGIVLLSACSNEPQQQSHTGVAPYLNLDEFSGLQALGNRVATLQLDYALDSASGGELPLNSCAAVEATGEEDVDPSQLHLL